MSLIRHLLSLLAIAGIAAFSRAEPLVAETTAQPVTPAHFLPQLVAQLSDHFRLEGELQLDLMRQWTPPPTPEGGWEMTVIAPPSTLSPQMIVRVRLTSAQGGRGEWNLPLRAQLWAEALVARKPVDRGQLLDSSLFDLRRTDFIRNKDAVPASVSLESLTVARGLPVGAVLSWRDVVRRSLVQRGSRVEVVVGTGSLTVTMKGLAMQSGALGETIVVRNPESRRDFTAVVTAENQARVTF